MKQPKNINTLAFLFPNFKYLILSILKELDSVVHTLKPEYFQQQGSDRHTRYTQLMKEHLTLCRCGRWSPVDYIYQFFDWINSWLA